MVEAKNFVEKILGKNLDEATVDKDKTLERVPEAAEKLTPTPPSIKKSIQEPVIQIVEKIVYKKERIHGFFRTLTILALLVIGFLMLGESTGIIKLSIDSFPLHTIFSIFIIFSTIIIRSYRGIFGKIFGLILFLTVFGGMFGIDVYTGLNPSSKRKSGDELAYTLPQVDTTLQTNLYVQTLIGNTYIEGNTNNDVVQGTRNSDRNLLVSSGQNTNEGYLKLIEDNNRNMLQNYASNIHLTVPNNRIIHTLYVKSFFGGEIIDLTTFQRNMFKFHAGIGDITIRVGNVLSGNKIEIQGAAANIEIDIPKDVGVMMYYKHFIGMLNVPGFESLPGNYFQSQNIATAKTVLHIYINLGIGKTKINRVEPKN